MTSSVENVAPAGGDIGLRDVVSPGQPQESPNIQTSAVAPPANTSSGSVQAFREIRRELSEKELASPGVYKLILDRLDGALAQCERLASFEGRFHEKDKRVEVLEEKLSKRTALDLAWGAGISIGLALVSLAPVVWDTQPSWIRVVFLVVGALLIVAGIAIRVILK
jgi:hypothetical protein